MKIGSCTQLVRQTKLIKINLVDFCILTHASLRIQTVIINHAVARITNLYFNKLKRFVNPEEIDKNDPDPYYYVPCEDIKKRTISPKRMNTILNRHYYANIMEVLKYGTMNPDYKSNASFTYNRPFYFICHKLKNKILLKEKGIDPLVKQINKKLNVHEIKTLKQWERKVSSVMDIFFLMHSWYVQYEIKTMKNRQLVKLLKPYEEAAQQEQNFNVKDYKHVLIKEWNVALWAEDIFKNKNKRSMTDWMDIDIDENGEVTIEKKNRNDVLEIQTAETCMDLAVLLGLKLCKLCKAKDNNEEETEQIPTNRQLQMCEQILNELASLSGAKKVHIQGEVVGRKKKYVVHESIIEMLNGVALPRKLK